MTSKESVATLEGHSNGIHCLEKIDENRFATGSEDKTIKIWNAQTFACLETLNTGYQYGVNCLKRLPSNRLASGSYREIKIWSIESTV